MSNSVFYRLGSYCVREQYIHNSYQDPPIINCNQEGTVTPSLQQHRTSV